MSTRIIIAAALIAASAAVSAQEATPDVPQPYAGTTTRAEVRADLLKARSAGSLLVTELDRQSWPAAASALSRAEVRAEVLKAARSGDLQRLHAETNAFDVRPVAADARDASSIVAGTPRSAQ